MTFLPIVVRELRVTARKRSTYWIRFAAAALALAIGAWSMLFLHSMGAMPSAGRVLFGGLTGLAWLYAVMGGVFKTADALSEEKREGTLGLLFLTDLKGYDIVLGKIVAASVNWLFGLLALFPVLALALLMGGVAPGEFWRKILALTNLLFYSLALGMFVSACLRSERRAAALTIALLMLLLWGPASLADWHQKSTGARELAPWLVFPDVARALKHADDYLYGRNPEFYWGALGGSHAVGWLYLLLASVIVPRTWQQQAGRLARWQENAEQFTYGKNRARRKRFRESALGINPFYWVAGRARGRALGVFLVLGAIVGCYAVNFYFDPASWNSPSVFVWPALFCFGVLKVWLAFEACRRFVEDRRSGALELILSTPLTPEEIISGQWRALRQQFAAPAIGALLLTLALGCLSIAVQSPGTPAKDRWLFVLMLAAAAVVFVADLVALGWLAMWRGLKARHSYIAWLWSTVQILFAPWVLFYLGLTAFMMLVIMPQFLSGGGAGVTTMKAFDWLAYICTGLWLVVSLAMAFFSAWWSRRCLKRHFRYQATVSYQPQKAVWSPPPQPVTVPPPLA